MSNKIQEVMENGEREFNLLWGEAPAGSLKAMKGADVVNHIVKHQKALLEAMLEEVGKVDTYTGDDLADRCAEGVKNDIETIINKAITK